MCQNLFNWIQEKFITALLRAIDEQNFSVLAIACFEFLLKHQALYMKAFLWIIYHIQWITLHSIAVALNGLKQIRTCNWPGGILMFIRSEKLFWTDDFTIKIIALRTSKKHFNANMILVYFGNCYPTKSILFRTNSPNTRWWIRIYFNSLINFESILQFRKGIKIKTNRTPVIWSKR